MSNFPQQSRLLKLVHYMGGSVKNEIKDNVTHLLAYSSTGEKYQYANTFNIPIMSEDWVHAAWAHRDEVGARASTDSMVSHYDVHSGWFDIIIVLIITAGKETVHAIKNKKEKET